MIWSNPSALSLSLPRPSLGALSRALAGSHPRGARALLGEGAGRAEEPEDQETGKLAALFGPRGGGRKGARR